MRPTTSDTGPATSSASPRPTVLSDTERALCAGGHREGAGQLGQQRLGAVEQRERRQARAEEGDGDAAVPGVAEAVAVGAGGRRSGWRGSGGGGGAWHRTTVTGAASYVK